MMVCLVNSCKGGKKSDQQTLAHAKIGSRVVDPKVTDPPGETLPCE
jgi:hypothetical protein